MSNGEDKVSEAITLIAPQLRPIINELIARANVSGDIAVDKMLDLYPPNSLKINHTERMALLSLAFVHRNKFAPKMTFTQRCEVLALHKWGVTRETLAKMYKVDRRTITHIYNPMSTHYKDVRNMAVGLGDKFIETYLTPEIIDKALAFRQVQEVKPQRNNKFAKAKAGVHVVRGKNCEYEHRVMIAWRELGGDIEIAGWYYRDLDSDYPENWFSVGNESMQTSQKCYTAMLNDITDRLPVNPT